MWISAWSHKINSVHSINNSDIYGEHGLLEYTYKQLQKKGHMVIVVAEGAGTGVQDLDSLKTGIVKDESGNAKLPVIYGTIIGYWCVFEGWNCKILQQ